MMRVTVNLNDEDYIAFNISHQFSSKTGRDSILFGKILHLILLIGLIIFICTLDAGPILTVVEIAAVIAFYVYLILSYDNRLKKRIRKRIENMKNRTIIGIVCIVLALILTFAIAPLVNKMAESRVDIIRMKNDVIQGIRSPKTTWRP